VKANVKVKWNGNLAIKKERKAAEKAFKGATEHILTESNKVAPLDEGTLTRSGNTDVNVTPAGVEASVYYDTPYAVKLHEHPEYNFQNGRQGKYLEDTINEETATVREYLEKEYKKAFK